MSRLAMRDEKLCLYCGFCSWGLACLDTDRCVGCGACVDACPAQARRLESVLCDDSKKVKITVDGRPYHFPVSTTLLQALEKVGYIISGFPGEGQISAPCRTGGCWNCAVLVDGELKPSCITPVKEGMRVVTEPVAISEKPPLRLVSNFSPHQAGGVGTPHWLKPKGLFTATFPYVELACFTHGCNLRCPTCQNWEVTYTSRGSPVTPVQAAEALTLQRQQYNLNRIAVSGGESTLNRRWLLELLRTLRRLNPPEVRLHVDTNTTTLTPDYVDELVAAGMTDIGTDLKAIRTSTFMKITGVTNTGLAEELMRRSWSAVEYLLYRYRQEVFVGIGIPCNPSFVTVEEIQAVGRRLAALDSSVQVCLLDYRPEFRRQDIIRPAPEQMLALAESLKETGLECVTCQTERGNFGP